MLNSVGTDRRFGDGTGQGICNWVWRFDNGSSWQQVASDQPDTETGFGILCHFYPIGADRIRIEQRGDSYAYWGSGSPSEMFGILTDLRATILCFCAAINNEL